MAVSIVTCWPPETGVTEAILSTDVPLESVPCVSVYFQVFPTEIGNGTEAEETTDVEPPELPEPECVPAELLPAALLTVELGPPDEPGLAVLQPARSRPATAATAMAATAGRCGDRASAFMSM